jgi:hypothetical protein
MRRKRFRFDDLISGSTASALRVVSCVPHPQDVAT